MTDSHSEYLAVPVHRYEVDEPMSNSKHIAKVAMGVDHLVLGPMPAHQFTKTFFPSMRFPSAFKEGMFEPLVKLVQAHTKETLMYQPFVRILYLLVL